MNKRRFYENFLLNPDGTPNTFDKANCGHQHETAPEAFLCLTWRSERRIGIAATFKVTPPRLRSETAIYERVQWVAEGSDASTNPPGSQSELEAAYALTRIAMNVPITDEGRFLMMDCNNAAMDLVAQMDLNTMAMIRERIAKAQQRLGYVGGLA